MHPEPPALLHHRPRGLPGLHLRLVNERTSRWAVVVPLGADEFGPIQDWHYFHGSEDQARLERDRLRLQLADGTYVPKKPTPRSRRWRPELEGLKPLSQVGRPPGGAPVLTRDVITEWLDLTVDTVSASCARRYRSQAAHLIAYFGELPIRTIGPEHIVAYRSFCLTSGGRYGRPLARGTVKEHLARLRSVMDLAEVNDLLDRHPWSAVPHKRNKDPFAPKTKRRRKRVLLRAGAGMAPPGAAGPSDRGRAASDLAQRLSARVQLVGELAAQARTRRGAHPMGHGERRQAQPRRV